MTDDSNKSGEKPLEKLTVKELREIAGGMEEITGVHGMKKDELVAAIKKVRGIPADVPKAEKGGAPVDIKGRIREFKGRRTEALASGDRKAARILRRRINRLKKKSRRAA